MIYLKSQEEIEKMRKAGAILKSVKQKLKKAIEPGITTEHLDKLAQKAIKAEGGSAGFKTVEGYKWALCTPVNEQIVHTPPSDYRLKENDVLTVDMGVMWEGFHSDSAFTVSVGRTPTSEIADFLSAGSEALEAAILKAKESAHIGDISAAMESFLKDRGYSVSHDLTGHGIGRDLHEDPLIPCFSDDAISDTPEIKNGMALAIEVIYCMGKDCRIKSEKGKEWSIVTRDGSISACFEETVAIYNSKTTTLT